MSGTLPSPPPSISTIPSINPKAVAFHPLTAFAQVHLVHRVAHPVHLVDSVHLVHQPERGRLPHDALHVNDRAVAVLRP